MKRKTILTLGAIAAVAVIGGATIPAVAGGGPWGTMGGHAPGMMMQGTDGAGWASAGWTSAAPMGRWA